MIYKKTTFWILALLCGSSLLAGETTVIRVGHFPNITHAQGVIGHALTRAGKGWFEERLGPDIQVDWYVYDSGPTSMEALLAGSIDLTYVGPSPTINAYVRSQRNEMRVVAGACSGGAALVVQDNSPIKSVEDFRGKVMATPQLGNTQDISARWWLRSHGFHVTLQGGDVQVVPTTNPDLYTLFLVKEVDAAWTDLHENHKMDWEFDCALKGNVALMGEIALEGATDFTLALAFGSSHHDAATTLLQSLGVPYRNHRKRFVDQWHRVCKRSMPLEGVSGDGGNLYEGSQSLLLAHEDKRFAGALIASMSIPWGEAKGDEDMGGYHLVWTRDMVHTSMGLLAAGNTETPLRALIYLAASQQPDGGFAQNFWVDGEPYWKGIQLDEVAFPVLLAFRLKEEKGLGEFDPYPMVMRAARYLMCHGPATPQERWEEASGYSPSTLASNIAALICAACFARATKDITTADYLEAYADFLNRHVEEWTVTTAGTLHPDIPKHYIRIHPVDPTDPDPNENPNEGIITLANGPIGERNEFPAKDIIDHGFLELVRYGIRDPADPLIKDSLRVVDAVLKKDTPFGACWRRYNHDGYGQCDDGSPFTGAGTGRLWPLLAGERGHYELAAGGDVKPYIKALEGFASCTGLIPEQVWDSEDIPEKHLYIGKPTGSAMPLMWAHAEYVQLLRSTYDGGVFDLIPAVAARYLLKGNARAPIIEFWKPNRYAKKIRPGETLRIQTPKPFRLRWTADDWKTVQEAASTHLPLGVDFVDIVIEDSAATNIQFTFFWINEDRWEDRNYNVSIEQ